MDRNTHEPLAKRLELMEQDMATMRRRLHVLVCLCFLALIIVLLWSPGADKAIAQQTGGLPALERRVAALEARTSSQQTLINTLSANLNAEIAARQQGDADTLTAARVYADEAVAAEAARAQAAEAALQTSVNGLQTLTAPLSLSGIDLTIRGVNVHIVSGSGRTDDNVGSGGTLTGLGNLIIGYPGEDSIYPHTGSHNLVLGDHNGYTSYGGLVAGEGNQILGPYCTITGGTGNTARNYWSSINGGFSNLASGQGSVVNGGQQNTASESYAVVSGGYLNVVTAFRGWAGGSYHSP
jgi:hypothetical protein